MIDPSPFAAASKWLFLTSARREVRRYSESQHIAPERVRPGHVCNRVTSIAEEVGSRTGRVLREYLLHSTTERILDERRSFLHFRFCKRMQRRTSHNILGLSKSPGDAGRGQICHPAGVSGTCYVESDEVLHFVYLALWLA